MTFFKRDFIVRPVFGKRVEQKNIIEYITGKPVEKQGRKAQVSEALYQRMIDRPHSSKIAAGF